jgi:hypothetical protein
VRRSRILGHSLSLRLRGFAALLLRGKSLGGGFSLYARSVKGSTVALAVLALLLYPVRSAFAAPPWVERQLTLPAGDWAFDVGGGLAHVPDRTGGGANLEMGVGIVSRVELGLRTGLRPGDPVDRGLSGDYYARFFDRQTFDEGAAVFANPEVRVRGALVRGEIFELALEGRLVVPFADGTDAGVLFGVPMAAHFGDRVRLDFGVYLPTVFVPNGTELGIHLPIDVWIQATPRFWVGPMSGIAFDNVGDRNRSTNFSLGCGFGYSITHYLDFKAEVLFPTINNDGRVFGMGAGVQIRIE